MKINQIGKSVRQKESKWNMGRWYLNTDYNKD